MQPVIQAFSICINGAVVPLLAAAAISAVLCWLLIRFSDWLPFKKEPLPERWHRRPTPDSGGVAIFAAAALVYAIALPGRYPALTLGATLFWATGLIDDRLGLRPQPKLIAQLFIAAGVALSGVSFDVFPWEPVNIVFTVFWLVGITNALNLIDNMDGLAAGAAIIIAVFRAVLLSIHGYREEALLCGVLAAASAGFLIFNFHPAKIFMGDGGSMFIGFSLAALTVASPPPHTRSAVAAFFYPALTFAYPIFDTALVTLLRRAAGRPISAGGRDHSSHRLASLGLSERTVVIGLWTFTAVGAAAGLLLQMLPLIAAALVALLFVFASLFGLFLATLPGYQLPLQLPVGRLRRVSRWSPSLRAGVAILIDGALAGAAISCAFLLRFDLALPPIQLHYLMVSIPAVTAAHSIATIVGRTYLASWTYFDVPDILPVLGASAASAVIAGGCLILFLPEYSRGVAILYFMLLAGIALSARASLRMLRSMLIRNERIGRRVAIVGADSESEALVRYLRCSHCVSMIPILLIDDRPERIGARIAGLPVRGLSGSLQALRDEFAIETILIPVRWAGRDGFRERIHQAGLDICSVDISIRSMEVAACIES